MKPVTGAIAFGFVLASGVLIDAQRPTYRSTVNLVTVDVAVVRGRTPVTGLKANNFAVYDDGVRQSIDLFTGEALPLDATVVLDVSGSVRANALLQLKNAAWGFVGALMPDDRAALVTFSHQILVQQSLTTDKAAVGRAIGSIEAGGTTALYDAAYVALHLTPGAEGRRSVAVVLTDGADNASWLSAARVLEAVERSQAVVYGIALNQAPAATGGQGGVFDDSAVSRSSPVDRPRYRFLRQVAEASGGRLFDTAWVHLDSTFTEVLESIRGRYLLGYSRRAESSGWHKIEVRLVGVRGTVTTRRGYWTAPRGEP